LGTLCLDVFVRMESNVIELLDDPRYDVYGQHWGVIDFVEPLLLQLSPFVGTIALTPELEVTPKSRNKDWKEFKYQYFTLKAEDRYYPMLIDNEVWVQGNIKNPKSISNYNSTLRVHLSSSEAAVVKPIHCTRDTCRSKKARTCVQVHAYEGQVLESSDKQIQVRLLCIPFHHEATSFQLHFEVVNNYGTCVASNTLEIGKPMANRSQTSRQLFLNPPLVVVLFFVQHTRATWRIIQH